MNTPRITHAASDGRRITWYCSTCDRPLKPHAGTGWIELVGDQMRAVDACRRYEAALEARSTRFSGFVVYNAADLVAGPMEGRWRATCQTCNGNDQGSGYFIDVAEISTVASVLHWSAHLSEKWWTAYTDWSNVCRIVAAAASIGRAA